MAVGVHLTPDDYRGIVAVLEDVVDVQSLAELADVLPDALERHLGWTDSFDAPTLSIVPDDGGLDPREKAIASTLQHLLGRLFHSLSYEQPFDDGWFTPREREIAQLVADGLTNRQIAAQLGVTPGTVKKHLANALAKADCTNRTQLAVVWRRAGPLRAS